MIENIETDSILLSGSYKDNYFNACSVETLTSMGVPNNEIDSLTFKYFKDYMTSKIQSHINSTLQLHGYDSESQLVVYATLRNSPYYEEANKLILWIYEIWNRWENIAANSILSQEVADNWLNNNVPVI